MASTVDTERPLKRFRLRPLVGTHTQTDPDGVERSYCGRPREKMNQDEINMGYQPLGTVIQSHRDLARQYPEKFERLFEDNPVANPYLWDPTKETLDQFTARMKGTPDAALQAQAAASVASVTAPAPSASLTGGLPPPVDDTKDTLDAMTEGELRKLCDDEELDHSNLRTRPELVAALRRLTPAGPGTVATAAPPVVPSKPPAPQQQQQKRK
jgi:hypothetical protein